MFGLAHIPFWWDIAAVSGWSLVIYYWAIAVRLPASEVLRLISEGYDEGAEPAVTAAGVIS
jgi:hypothetical protein